MIDDGHEWVKHMFDALIKMAGKRWREDILVIAGDGTFSQKMVTKVLNLPNARSWTDGRWHLVNAHFGENFADIRLQKFKPSLMKMVYANS